jgi:hypothetical protein
MRIGRYSVAVGILCLLAVGALRAQQSGAPAPTYIPQTQFDSGQDVQPVYEGWIKNSDGTFDFVFGYMNRNFKQELAIPAGPNNIVEPGGPDRGQPTYFLPRRQARLFRVRVPKDWGNKTLTWAITANGRTEKAYADLRAVEEINEQIMQSGGNSLPFEPGNANPNQPPSISLAPIPSATVSGGVQLTARVTDDGLPKPRTTQAPPPSAGRQTQAQSNFGAAQSNNSGGGRGRGGLTVRWVEYGGPAAVTFSPPGAIPVSGGTATVTAQFTAPGNYKLVAFANDGQLTTRADATVTVK